MSIRRNAKRKRNPWECRWIEAGKHYSRSFPTRKDAEQFDAERKTALTNGSGFRTRDEKLTLNDYAERFLAQKKRSSTEVRNRSIYARHIQPTLGSLPIRQIRYSDIQKLVDSWVETGLKPRTIQRQIAVASGIFSLAERDGVILRVPTKGVKVPQADEPHRYMMSVEEVLRLRAAVHPNYEAFIYTLCESGMRIGEAINLNIGDFDWKRGTLRISVAKTKAGVRMVRISATAQALISAHIQATGRSMANENEPLFVSHRVDNVTGLVTGTRINYSNFSSRVFKVAARSIGLPELEPHDLRRTAATFLVNTDSPEKVTQGQLGHTDIRTTMNLYVKTSDEAVDTAVRRLEEVLNPGLDPAEKRA